jgi:hypothetical protein
MDVITEEMTDQRFVSSFDPRIVSVTQILKD